MRLKSFALVGSLLALPFALSAPSDAKTAYQYWAQGQGAYVSSTDHPPFEFQEFLVGGTRAYPPAPYGYSNYVTQPYGYSPYGYEPDEPAY